MLGETNDRFPEMGDDGLPLTALSRELYTSPEWFQRDIERVFRRRWLFVCHISEVKAPGDYTTFEIGEDSIIVARDQKGQINAFYNVCRHRGSRLCQPGHGNVKAFICPFHNWTYNLDGTLRGAPYMPDLDKSCYGAKSVWCEVWNGMIFINLMKETPKPVSEYLQDADFSGHRLEHARVIEARNYPIKANWKLNGETYQECYHCAVVHRDSLARIIELESHEAFHDAPNEQAAQDNSHEFVMYSPDMRIGSLKPGVETQTADGKIASKRLLGDGTVPQPPKLVQWFPGFSVGAFPDYAFVIDWVPISALETNFRTRWLVHEDAVEGVDYNLADIIWMADKFNIEDKIVVEGMQEGIISSAYTPGPLHKELELYMRKFLAAYIPLVKD